MASVENILVFLPNWVGDVVMATPVLRTLRENNPTAKITLFGKPVVLALLEGSSWCDSRVPDSSRGGLRGFWRTVKELRGVNPNTALLLPNSFRSAVLARLAGAKRRIGYARDGRGFLLTDSLKPQRRPKDSPGPGKYLPIPTSQYYAKLLQPLGLTCDNLTMELPLTEQDHAAATDLLTEAGYDPTRPLVILNPGAAFGTSKLWPAERYAQLADKLVEQYNAQIILNGAPNENERGILTKLMGEMQNEPLIDFAHRDNTIGLLKGLMLRCQMLITNDTGARHIAAAMGIGVVTIFGSTDPIWAQIDYPRERIVRIDVPCAPCQQKICPLPQGPEHHQCMTGISVDAVLQAADEILDSRDEAEASL